MSELKITIDQLKNYLFTNLKISFHEDGELYDFVGLEEHYQGVMLHHKFDGCVRSELKFIKLNCHRLSDLDKFIPELGFVPLGMLPYGHKLGFYKPSSSNHDLEITIQTEDYSQEIDFYDGFKIMTQLFQWNFWPFGDEYFEAGLVIDKLLNNSPTN